MKTRSRIKAGIIVNSAGSNGIDFDGNNRD
jgi:hypothetical protein